MVKEKQISIEDHRKVMETIYLFYSCTIILTINLKNNIFKRCFVTMNSRLLNTLSSVGKTVQIVIIECVCM